MARFSEAGTQGCNLYLSVPVNFPKLEGGEDSYPELGRSINSPAFLCYAFFNFFYGNCIGAETELLLNSAKVNPKDIHCHQTLIPTL